VRNVTRYADFLCDSNIRQGQIYVPISVAAQIMVNFVHFLCDSNIKQGQIYVPLSVAAQIMASFGQGFDSGIGFHQYKTPQTGCPSLG
jgi:hypothetical protein